MAAFGGGSLAAPPSAADLRAALAALEADDYAAREAASGRLIDAGASAIEVLAGGVQSASPEAAWRASAALEQIALRGDEQTLVRVTAALERLSDAKPGLSTLAKELRAKQAVLRHDRAAAKIRSLGGRFSSDGEGVWLADGGFGGGILAPPAVVEVIDEVVIERVADDIKALVEVGDKAIDRAAEKELETPPDLKAFGDALRLAADTVGKPVAAKAQDPAPPPAELPAADAPPVIEGGAIGLGEIFIADAVGIDIGFADGSGDDAQEALVLDKDWKGGDTGLAALRDLPRVVSIQIEHAPLTDAALVHLAALPRLADLSLRGTQVTPAALHKFHRQEPGVRIFARGDAMLGVNADTGGPCILSSVYYGSGAYEAGLAQGDEIVAVDGLKTHDFSDLTIAVFAHKPGEKLKVEFKRDGKLRTLEVVLKDRKDVEPGRR